MKCTEQHNETQNNSETQNNTMILWFIIPFNNVFLTCTPVLSKIHSTLYTFLDHKYICSYMFRDTDALFVACKQNGLDVNAEKTKRRGSSVGIATRYGLDVPGVESRWGRGEIFRTRQDRPWCPPSLLYNGYRVSFGGGGVKRPGRGVDHPHHPAPRLKRG